VKVAGDIGFSNLTLRPAIACFARRRSGTSRRVPQSTESAQWQGPPSGGIKGPPGRGHASAARVTSEDAVCLPAHGLVASATPIAGRGGVSANGVSRGSSELGSDGAVRRGPDMSASDRHASVASVTSAVAAEERSDEDRLPAATGRGLSTTSRKRFYRFLQRLKAIRWDFLSILGYVGSRRCSISLCPESNL
jgi:hypothetical protein